MLHRVPVFYPSGPEWIPGKVIDFMQYPRNGYVSFTYALCVVSGEGPDIILTRNFGEPCPLLLPTSVLVYSNWLCAGGCSGSEARDAYLRIRSTPGTSDVTRGRRARH